MYKIQILLFLSFLFVLKITTAQSYTGNKEQVINSDDFNFLERLTKDVLESSRIYPEQTISPDFGSNDTGGILIRPGGSDCYPSFWIRDYAMSLESCFVTAEEQKHMLFLTASTQCNQTWITDGGSIVPYGAIADHIRIDNGLPIYFPGTYSYEGQGTKQWGKTPPYGDQFFFIHMAYYYIKQTSDYQILSTEINGIKLIDRLEIAFNIPSTRLGSPIIYTTVEHRGVDFGFRDAIQITGDLCFPSILKYRASKELYELFGMIQNNSKTKKFKSIAENIKTAIPQLFMDKRGMLLASTGKSNQPDVWSTALAVYFGVLDGDTLKKTCRFLADSYQNGTLAYKGNIRHVLTNDDYDKSTAWEVSLAKKDTYQNGSYWGTPAGWVCYAIAQVDMNLAQKLASEYIEELRTNDYRKGEKYGAPYECFHPSGYRQNPIYLTSVSCPYSVFKSMKEQIQ